MKQINHLFTQIKNSYLSNTYFLYTPATNFKYQIWKFLKLKGYIKNWYWIHLKFENILFLILNPTNYLNSIHGIKYFNPKSQKNYLKKKDLKFFNHLNGTLILSTSKGILSSFNAYKLGIGGRMICYIW